MIEKLLAENKQLRIAVARANVENAKIGAESAAKNVRRLKNEYEESVRALDIRQAISNRLAASLADAENS